MLPRYVQIVLDTGELLLERLPSPAICVGAIAAGARLTRSSLGRLLLPEPMVR
jgi:hypothetical protein